MTNGSYDDPSPLRDQSRYTRKGRRSKMRSSSRSNTGSTPRVSRARNASLYDRSAYTYAQRVSGHNYIDEEEMSPYRDRERYRRIEKKPKSKARRFASFLLVLGLIAIVGVGGVAFAQTLPITITLNGTSFEVGGNKTIEDVLRKSGIKPKPGDLVAIDGSILEEGKGQPFCAVINGKPTSDPQAKLSAGDVVELKNGEAIEEPSEVIEEVQPFEIIEQGNGPIHVLEGEGVDGQKRTKTGKTSGLVIEEVLQEPANITRHNFTPEVGGDKVIALTFDDGPWQDYTAQILDILRDNGAKATFFTVGGRISGDGVELVKRAVAEGHQVCTHSFDHASGSGEGVNLGYMTPEEQVAEIEQGYAAIEAATGTPASRVIRTPGGNFGPEVMRPLQPIITAEIGWNIDTTDWEQPGVDAIAGQIEGAWPGAIVLMHDGGGDRSQTVEALRRALPALRDQGYRFITIDELMSYPLV